MVSRLISRWSGAANASTNNFDLTYRGRGANQWQALLLIISAATEVPAPAMKVLSRFQNVGAVAFL